MTLTTPMTATPPTAALRATAHDSALWNEDLAPTTPEQRTWSRWHIAALWVGMAVCIPTYQLASGLVDQGWSWKIAVLSVTLGNVVVLVPMVLNAHAGTRYGIPFPILLRSSFGVLGANVPALMRALVACGWFGIQTWIGGSAIYILCGEILPSAWDLPQPLPDWLGISTGQLFCFLLFWAINVVIIARGIETIRVLETWSAPFLLALGVALFAWAWWRVGDLGAMLAEPAATRAPSWGMIGVGLTTAVSFWGTLALNIPDFARFARSQRDQVIGQAVGLPPTMALFAFIGAAVTNATALIFGARISNPVALTAKIGGPALTLLAMFGLAIATLTTNLAANVVSPANDFSNLSPRRISFRRGAFIAAGVGIVILPWKLMADAGQYLFTWLLGYGAMLGAVGGVMIADYFVLRRCRLAVADLYRRGGAYEYRRGFNLIALGALALGIAPNVPGFLAALGVVKVGAPWTTFYEWAWFCAFFTAGITYTVAMHLCAADAVRRAAAFAAAETDAALPPGVTRNEA
jgi:NCS1 family nucleobase:cation symporter-1